MTDYHEEPPEWMDFAVFGSIVFFMACAAIALIFFR